MCAFLCARVHHLLCAMILCGLPANTNSAADIQGGGKTTGEATDSAGGLEVVMTPSWPLYFSVGETVSVDCGVYTEGRHHDYIIQWLNGKSETLNTGQRINVTNNFDEDRAYSVLTLSIGSLVGSDSQTYTCQVKANVSGEAESKSIQIIVQETGERCGFESEDLCGWKNEANTSLKWIRHHGLDTEILDRSRGPRYDHTYGPSKHIGHFIDVDLEEQNSPQTLSKALLVSPKYPASPQTMCLHFWYVMDGTDQDKLVLSLKNEGSSNWTELMQIQQPSGAHWVHQMADIPPQNHSFWLGFEAHTCTGKCDKAAVALDDIVLESAYCEKTAIQWPNVDLKVRLVGGGSSGQSGQPTQGRLEVLHDGQYGSVCSRQFGNNEAKVVCRALGFENVDSAVKVRNSSYGQVAANLPIWLTKLQCEGTERDLSLCIGKNQSWGNTGGCTHEEDAGVICVQPDVTKSSSTKLPPAQKSSDTPGKSSALPASTSGSTDSSTTTSPVPSSTTVTQSTSTHAAVISDKSTATSTEQSTSTPKISTSQKPSSTTASTTFSTTTETSTQHTTPTSPTSKTSPSGSGVNSSSAQPVIVDADDDITKAASRIGRGVVAGIVLIVLLAIAVLVVLVYKGRKRRLHKSKYLNFGSASYSREHLPTNEFHLESPLTMSSMGYTVLA